ncbi:hypothetical protein [Streptosporangium canum]|uniref:hypothetical protein n=1 Tax=Streptosporangium canum TaxID=324952 RepID=UPI0037A80CFE
MPPITDSTADAGLDDIHPVAAVILACTRYAAHAGILANQLSEVELTRDEREQVLAAVSYATTASTDLIKAVTPRSDTGNGL